MTVAEHAERSVEIPSARSYEFTYTPVICPRCRSWTGIEVQEGHVRVRCKHCAVTIDAYVIVLGDSQVRVSGVPKSSGGVHECVYTPIVCPKCRSRTGAEIPEGKASVYCRKCKLRIWVWIDVTDEVPRPESHSR
jgi:hypothetical protein